MTEEQKRLIGEAEARYDEVAGRARLVDDTLTAMTREFLRAAREGTTEEAVAAHRMKEWAESLHAAYGDVLLLASEGMYAAANAALPNMTAEEEAYYRAKCGD